MEPARLKKIDVFAALRDEELVELADAAQEAAFEEGDELLHHGTWPDDLLAIEEGAVEVRRDGETIARLEAGSVVGERGVLRRALRNADVVATEPVRALFFHRNRVRELRRDVPELDERLRALAEERGA